MNGTTIKWLGCLLVVTAIGLPSAIAARRKVKSEAAAPLTAVGQQLETR
jgi:hypothetical protein